MREGCSERPPRQRGRNHHRSKSAASASIAAHGGKYLVRGGEIVRLEGRWHPKRFVVVEFPSSEQAKKWWESVDYAGPKRLRQSSAETDMFIVEGV